MLVPKRACKLASYFWHSPNHIFLIDQNFVSGKFHVGVEGLEEAVTSLAGCCKPVPGDEIIGYISKNQTIKIHRKNCKSTSHLENDQLLVVSWIEFA